MAYPVAAAAQTFANTGPTPQTAEPLTPSEQETCDDLYAELKPMAIDQARAYVMNRTPVRLQEAMAAKVEADWPVPPAADTASGRARNPGGDPPAIIGSPQPGPMFGNLPLQNQQQPPPQDPRYPQGIVTPDQSNVPLADPPVGQTAYPTPQGGPLGPR